jgi:hypothetical protein
MANEPTITSKALPPAMQPGAIKSSPPVMPPRSVEVEIPYEQIEAKPLRAPNFINLWPNNPNLTLFWGNRAVGEKESGLRYDQLIAMGFVPAQPQDVHSRNPESGQHLPCPPSICRDGRIMYGDLILLKIPRVDYVGALKWNEQSARQRVRKPGVALEGVGASKDIGGREVLKNDGRASETAAGFPRKVHPYVPTLAETDAKTADNSGPEINLADPPKRLD